MATHVQDLSRVEAWIFDLDNTLYPASANLFSQIDRRMKAYISATLGLPTDKAFALQKRYYHEHGTTLRGLMLNHSVDPDAFLNFVHDIDHSALAPDPALHDVLTRLPGRKFIYTNGSARHATCVMDRLGVAGHFAGIFDIRASGYIPKPDPQAYVDLIARHAIAPMRAVMFEDSHKNLKPAADLGMATVWIRHAGNAPALGEDLSHCQFITHSLIEWLQETAERLPPQTPG